MPYKYIGKTIDHKGKRLWEIVGNLKNFGVGRIVARNMYERYPEPCYMKILKVEGFADPVPPSLDNPRRCKVTVERTFRGKTFPDPVIISIASYKADYKLIPKDEEEAYCNRKVEAGKIKLVPKTMPFPPLLREMIKREAKESGNPLNEDPRMEILYNTSLVNTYRVVKDGEKPDIDIPIDLGTPVAPNLYKGI